MRATLRLGGVDLGIVTDTHRLEGATSVALSPYLCRFDADCPNVELRLAKPVPSTAGAELRVTSQAGGLEFEHPAIGGHLDLDGSGVIHVPAHPAAVSLALEAAVAIAALGRGGMLVRATLVDLGDRSELVVGGDGKARRRSASDDAVLCRSRVVVYRGDVWWAATTPFEDGPVLPNELLLTGVRLAEMSRPGRSRPEASTASAVAMFEALLDAALVPIGSPPLLRAAFAAATDLAAQLSDPMDGTPPTVAVPRTLVRTGQLDGTMSPAPTSRRGAQRRTGRT